MTAPEIALPSAFPCNVGMLKTPFRAETETGTVMFRHCLAATEPASTRGVMTKEKCMMAREDISSCSDKSKTAVEIQWAKNQAWET